MDIGKAFTFVFEDEEWITKVLVGGLFLLASCVLIGIPFLLGYMIALMRNVMQGVEKPLPKWENLGGMFRDGLILILIFIVWLIPVWVLMCLQWLLTWAFANGSDAGAAMAVITTCVSCLYGIWGLVVALFTPAIYVRFARTPEFRSGFEFAELWQFTRDNIGNVIIAILLGWVASIIGSLGVILCVIGVFVTLFWASVVEAHLYAQVYVYRKGQPAEAVAAE